jgi:hypothetical protein
MEKHIPFLILYQHSYRPCCVAHKRNTPRKYYQNTKTSLFMKNCYNIGNMAFGFYVNLANNCTDITLEIHESCTMKGTAKARIGNP